MAISSAVRQRSRLYLLPADAHSLNMSTASSTLVAPHAALKVPGFDPGMDPICVGTLNLESLERLRLQLGAAEVDAYSPAWIVQSPDHDSFAMLPFAVAVSNEPGNEGPERTRWLLVS